MTAPSIIPGRYAAIDIGTVTCRMLVADINEKGILTVVDRRAEITNLGEGVDATHRLKPAAIERASATIAGYVDVLKTLACPTDTPIPFVTIGTSASRDAENAREFADRLAALGVDVEVVEGSREAALSFAGASVDFQGEDIVVTDVGGGSTEIIAGKGGASFTLARSFDIGCRRMTEKYLLSDPPTTSEIKRARAWVQSQMKPYFAKLSSQKLLGGRMVSVAGTATSVVSISKHMKIYDPERVHGTSIDRATLDHICHTLAALPTSERKKTVGLHPKRAPVIVAGLIILQEIMNLGSFTSFTASESDILQGLILNMAANRK